MALVPAGPSPCIAIPRSLHGWTGITQASSQVPPQRLSLITHHCLPPKCLPHPITLPHLNNLSLLRPLIWESGGFFFFFLSSSFPGLLISQLDRDFILAHCYFHGPPDTQSAQVLTQLLHKGSFQKRVCTDHPKSLPLPVQALCKSLIKGQHLFPHYQI